MARRLTLKISKGVKGGKPFYWVYCPARLAADGKARVVSFRRRADAEVYRGELFAAWQNLAPSPLPPAAQEDARRALALLEEAGLRLSLSAVVEQALPLLSRARRISVAQLVEEYAAIKEASWRPLSARNFRSAARRLMEAFGEKDAAEVSTADLERWLSECFPAVSSQEHAVRTLNAVFAYALRQKLIVENPFALLEKRRVKRDKAIDVLSPAEARRLMEVAPEDCKVAYALLLFAGLRPKELTRLCWGNVRGGFVHVSADIAKTRQVRNVELNATLAAWLRVFRPAAAGDFDRVVPANWVRKDKATRAAAGIADRPDVCRHSYATYYLAAYGAVDALKANMGHSRGSEVLFVHYRAAATPEQAAQFWDVLPMVRAVEDSSVV